MPSSVIITGGGSGLGKELAKQYASTYTVYLLGRDQSKLSEAASFIEQTGGTAETAVCDVTDMNQVEMVMNAIFTASSSVHMLINNAGTGVFGPLESLSENDIHTMIDTNVKGTIFPVMAALPHFQAQGRGTVMNIISTAGLRGKVNESVYCASKFAVKGFTESLAKEWEKSQLRAVAVYMGGMDTPFWDNSTHIKDHSRLKSPEKVAEMIVQQDDGKINEIFIDR
ncbi:SDR family NAD(P)-dependent oxidoreductase [Fictibacillus aquaticus]|uniref:Short-chain dehydrogenase n=1 Tax=Fictibacillus aquaticus TaxID=2021314 RepID=A0A235F5T0_9BACL|nr:SDR family oxidoreductase [Fictibacillus aquaticus]OYD56453.1 short-chain dehydrogenase [Fictibacillus aquaticus]